MIIYSESAAQSAGNKKYQETAPFPLKGGSYIYNDSYKYFLRHCKKMGLKAALSSSKDIIGPGLVKNFWTYDRKWTRHSGKASANLIFDKFTPANQKQKNKLKLLSSSGSVYLFNNKLMAELFQNKLKTYTSFPKQGIPTVEISEPSKEKILLAKNKLDKIFKNHPHKIDFNDGYLIKDKTGAGGHKIFKVDFTKKGIEKVLRQYKIDKKDKELLSYILQPFINGSQGFSFRDYKGFIDLRIILINQKIVQTYIRVARKGNYKCNEHQGGNLVYLPNTEIPKDVLKMVKKIVAKLNNKINIKHSLYALDFIKSNQGNIYFIEGNNNPGLDWNHKKKINEVRSKELIKLIIKELKLIKLKNT